MSSDGMRAAVPAQPRRGLREATLRRLILGLPLAFIFLSGAALATILVLLRGEASAGGDRLVQAFVRVAEEQTTRTIQGVDRTLQLAATKIEVAAPGDPLTGARVRAEFRDLLVDHPYIRAVWVLMPRAGSCSTAMTAISASAWPIGPISFSTATIPPPASKSARRC